jgi:cell division protein FtsW
MIYTRNIVMRDLRMFIVTVILLITIGCIFIYSSSSVYAQERCGSAHYYLIKQLLGIAIGLGAIRGIQLMNTERIKKISPYLFFGSLLLTALTLVPGLSRTIHGAKRWVNLGGIMFQPSELLKCSIIVYLAYIITKKDWAQSLQLKDYIPPLVALGISALVLLKQPDFGLAVTIVATILILLFINHMRIKHLLVALAAVLPVFCFLILMKAYRLRRILIFLNPWEDPRGAGFQIIQSLIAIGSGGWFGLGIGHSKQKFFYLPMQHTDFIFSVIAEETGFIGVTLLILLFVFLLYTGMHLAARIQDRFASLVIAGISINISLQAMVNFAVASGLLPTKGIGLPLVSYGISALVGNLIMVGLVIILARENAYTRQSANQF